MELNKFGRIVKDVFENLSIKYSVIDVNEFIIMPNHFHGIIILRRNEAGTTPGSSRP